MKLIADIGTNPELIKIDVTDVLLHHFLKHYDSIGVTEFILHGSDEVISAVKPNYQDLYKINFISISSKEFFNYRQRDCDMYHKLKKLNQLDDYVQQPPTKNICPLWIIQNDLKKQYIKEHELCFVLDLDEFVDLTPAGLNSIQDSDIEFCGGVLRDRIGESNEGLVTLNKQLNISEQLNQTIDLTKALGDRATYKVIITRGHLEHGPGHHGMYNINDLHKKKWPIKLTINHFKYFKQNIEGGLGPYGQKELIYLNNKYGK